MAAVKTIKVKLTGISLGTTGVPTPSPNVVGEGQPVAQMDMYNVSMTPLNGPPGAGIVPITFQFDSSAGLEVGQIYDLSLTKAKGD